MAAALRPSPEPLPDVRPKTIGKRDDAPLRAGTVNSQLQEPRRSARLETASAISDAAEGISNSRLGENFGGDLGGAKLKSGAMVATPGEVALLAPVGVATKTFAWIAQYEPEPLHSTRTHRGN